MKTINGVAIGDKFSTGKNSHAVIVDILEKRSTVTGNVVGHTCIAKAQGLATNEFEVAFSTVVRHKL